MYAIAAVMWFGAVMMILSLYREYKKDALMRKYRKDIARISGRTYNAQVISLKEYKNRTQRAG